MADPYSKETQLHRPFRRYRRKIASAKGWQKIVDEKQGPCRICSDPASNGRLHSRIEFHHVVTRQDGGDDIPDNIVPLCPQCHGSVTARKAGYGLLLLLSLTVAEHAYMVKRGGKDYPSRVYGAKPWFTGIFEP
jgi:5-methylcytosine-specific restriction endonuclease McrA